MSLMLPPATADDTRLVVQAGQRDGTWKSYGPRSVIGTGNMDRWRLYPLSFFPLEASLETAGSRAMKAPDFWEPH